MHANILQKDVPLRMLPAPSNYLDSRRIKESGFVHNTRRGNDDSDRIRSSPDHPHDIPGELGNTLLRETTFSQSPSHLLSSSPSVTGSEKTSISSPIRVVSSESIATEQRNNVINDKLVGNEKHEPFAFTQTQVAASTMESGYLKHDSSLHPGFQKGSGDSVGGMNDTMQLQLQIQQLQLQALLAQQGVCSRNREGVDLCQERYNPRQQPQGISCLRSCVTHMKSTHFPEVPERIVLSTIVSSVGRASQGLLAGLLLGNILLISNSKGNLIELEQLVAPLSRELRIFAYILAVLSWIGVADAALTSKQGRDARKKGFQSNQFGNSISSFSPRSYDDNSAGSSGSQSDRTSVSNDMEAIRSDNSESEINYMEGNYCSTMTSFILYTISALVIIISLPVAKYLQLEAHISSASEIAARQDVLRDVLTWEVMQCFAFITSVLGWLLVSCRLYSVQQIEYLVRGNSRQKHPFSEATALKSTSVSSSSSEIN
jgi:hypothetical protein